MPTRLANIDWSMITLNALSGAAIVEESIRDNTTGWTVGFLIVTIGILNLAKAYVTVRGDKKKEKKKT